MSNFKAPHLRLVKPEVERARLETAVLPTQEIQTDLFPLAKPWLMIFTDVSEISADSFVMLINEARPTFILDVRTAPRFDIGRLNRSRVFEIFEQNHIQYIDVAGLAGVTSRWDANLNPSFLVETINTKLYQGSEAVDGPIVILCDDKDCLSSAMAVFPKQIGSGERNKWDICLAP